MSVLDKLTIINAKRTTKLSLAEQRRGKLLAKLDEQLALAQALLAGTTHRVTRQVWVRQDNGERTSVTRDKRLRAWFWHDVTGKWLLEVRYGARVLELAKGKRVIEVGERAALCDVIQLLQQAVRNGELDAQIEAAAGVRKLKTAGAQQQA